MPGQYCFVCASNEGVFLDVTPDNRTTFSDQVETCLSTKINENIDLSNKICYKCAYELDQCTKFVQKYKKSHEEPKPNIETSMPCCFLCYELVESDRIFDITKDNNVIFNPLRKIRSIFNDDVTKKNGNSKLICLTCRYNLDVLYDLKRIYQETITNLKALINEEIDYSNFPKVHTDVVSRKTTITTFPDITFYGSLNSSDNEEDMARAKRHNKGRRTRSNAKLQNKSKVRNCDKCHNAVANGTDMYRFYHTGLTVCKNCWITMDPNSDKIHRRSRQVHSNLAETKLCAVFLTDVLSQGSHRKEKIQETEKDKDVNVLSDSSQEETKSSEGSPVIVSSKMRKHAVNGKARRGRKRRTDIERLKDDMERTPSKVTRLSAERANTNETKLTKMSVDAEQESSTLTIKKRQGRKRLIDNRSSDSDSLVEQRETRRSKMNDHANKKMRPRSILEETTSNARSDLSDEMSNEDSTSLRNKTKDSSSVTTPIKKEDGSTRSRTRSSSICSVEITPTEFKNPKSLTSQSEVKTEYTCDKCNKKFDTKLSNAKHRLTHLKQAALKLEKITVASVKEKQETEVDLQDDKISKEAASCSSRTVSVDKHTDDPSEDIAINVEDDTDDEELFSLSNEQNVKKKQGEEVSDEGDSVIDKPDVAESESRVKEESANDENSKIKESEQCKESTDDRVALDETVPLEREDDEDRQDTDIKDKHTTEDKDKTPANRDSDKSKDEDAQKTDVITTEDQKNMDEEKDKDVEIENDTDVEIENDTEVQIEKDTEVEIEKDTEVEIEKDTEVEIEKDTEVEIEKDTEVEIEKDTEVEIEKDTEVEIEKDTEVEIEKDTEVEIEKDTEVSSKEKEKTISECNNDKEDLHEETTCDSETTKSPILSTRNTTKNNKDHNESCENSLENNCEDDKDKIIEEPEIIQCDLTDESSKTDTKEPMEKVRKILPADKTETISDKKDVNDIITINENDDETLEEQQNKSDEENMEVEIIADAEKPDSAKDTIKPDLLNGEKHDEVKDDDDDDVTIVNSDDDRPKDKNVTEETVTTDDLTDKRKLEEEIKDLEELVKDNATNNKQENLNYVSDNNPIDAANEILKEVFELAAAEVQQREENSNTKNLDDVEMETLENISREIRKSADMPSLDPISIMEIDDDNDILLN